MKIETPIYPYFTGNPFVDAGIAALCALNQKNEPQQISKEDFENSAEYIANFYPNWPKLRNLFTQNCTLLNPSNRKNREAKYKMELKELLQKTTFASSTRSCAACGTREADTSLYRDKYPLTGSGDLVNYFSFFEPGFPVCATCTLAVQFVPLYVISNEGKLFLAHSHNTKIMLDIAKDALTHFKRRAAAGAEPTWYPSRSQFSKNAANECVIKLARDLILRSVSQIGPTTIRLYSFVNSGQINLLDYIDLPIEVFSFIEQAHLGGLKRNLDELFHNANRNLYHRLVNGDSIKPFFLRLKERKIIGGWELFELYLKEVEKLDTKRVEAIKRTGQRLYTYLKNTDFKRLEDLERATDKEYRDYLAVLTKIQKETPIWEVDDYLLLFPQDEKGIIFWRETAHVLLGYIYEQKHKEEK
jgi:CRISPR-associated protein Cst1